MKIRPGLEEKPYYRCFICPRFRKTCGGRPTREMDIKEWCEYMRDIRDYFGLSNDYITEKADSSSATTERIMAAKASIDIRRATARRYELAEIGPVGDYKCFLDFDHTAADQIASLKEEVASLKKDKARLEKIIDKYIE